MDDVTVLVATVVPSSRDSHSNSNPGLDPNSERDELGHASGGEDKQVFWGSAGSISAAVSWSVDSRMQGGGQRCRLALNQTLGASGAGNVAWR